MSLNITKEGIFAETNLNEYHIEPDDSVWEHVYHHVNPAANIFASSDPFTTGVYKNKDMWFNFQICNELTSWEFLLIQNAAVTNNSSKFRWVQTKNPLTAAYADVAAANITKNTSTGYTSFSHGGLYHFGTNTYLCTNNGSTSNWWGAIGAWSRHQNGIPCWNGVVVLSGQVDVYVRVDNNIAKFYKNNLQICNNFYEY